MEWKTPMLLTKIHKANQESKHLFALQIFMFSPISFQGFFNTLPLPDQSNSVFLTDVSTIQMSTSGHRKSWEVWKNNIPTILSSHSACDSQEAGSMSLRTLKKSCEAESEVQKETARIKILDTRMVPQTTNPTAVWYIADAHHLFLKTYREMPSQICSCYSKWWNISL